MSTPNLYVNQQNHPFADVPPIFQNNYVDVLYATDRQSYIEDGQLRYGHQRSASIAFGACRVTIGEDLPWDTLVRESLTHKRKTQLPIRVDLIEKWIHFPGTPIPFIKVDNQLVPDPIIIEQQDAAEEVFHRNIQQRLSLTPRKHVFLFVHGFNNDFDDAAITIAQLWHFIGRQGIPMIYTWPAGIGGFRGYFHDRESGEYTIFHLKQFLKSLAQVPELEKIHILAHSRGTDVVTSAIRELNIEIQASGGNTRDKLKLGNLILAAPDLDAQVTQQRIGAERLYFAPERFTVYTSRNDKAIGMADWLMESVRRVGQLGASDLTKTQKRVAALLPDLHMIDNQVKSDWIGHGYFHSNPAVSSDLILILRDNLDPGEQYGRPLSHRVANFWELNEDYPNYNDN